MAKTKKVPVERILQVSDESVKRAQRVLQAMKESDKRKREARKRRRKNRSATKPATRFFHW